MNGKCDWEGCNKKAKHKIGEFNIKLCEKHFNMETEPQIILKRLPKLSEKPTEEIKRITHILFHNGKKMRFSNLKQNIPTLDNNTLEEMVINNLVQID